MLRDGGAQLATIGTMLKTKHTGDADIGNKPKDKPNLIESNYLQIVLQPEHGGEVQVVRRLIC